MWIASHSVRRRSPTGLTNGGRRPSPTTNPRRAGGIEGIGAILLRTRPSHRLPIATYRARIGGAGSRLTLAAVLLSLVPVASAHASLASDRREQYRYGLETMNLTADRYVSRANNFRANGCWQWYRPKNCRKPLPYNYFEWTTDGCSGPTGRLPPAGSWTRIFDAPCQQHDFGYRNFSKNLTLQRTESMRTWIDRRFKTEMDRVCSSWPNDTFFDRSKSACFKAAAAMYKAVGAYNYWFASWGR